MTAKMIKREVKGRRKTLEETLRSPLGRLGTGLKILRLQNKLSKLLKRLRNKIVVKTMMTGRRNKKVVNNQRKPNELTYHMNSHYNI